MNAENVSLTGSFDDGIELDKRFYAPGYVLKFTCPKCKRRHERDLERHCLYYPETNKPKGLHLYCGSCDLECGYASIVVRVSLELAPEGATEE